MRKSHILESDVARNWALALLLTALAGYVDAVGFLTLGHLFVSFMSGNSTQVAVSLARGKWPSAMPAAAIVVLFVAGVVGGRLLGHAAGNWRRPVILLVEAVLLGAAAVASSRIAMIVPMVLAMGAQNAVIHQAGSTKTRLTYVTGTLVSFGEKLADAISGYGRRLAWLPYFCLWTALVAGAATGAAGYRLYGPGVLWLPAAIALLLCVLEAIECRAR